MGHVRLQGVGRLRVRCGVQQEAGLPGVLGVGPEEQRYVVRLRVHCRGQQEEGPPDVLGVGLARMHGNVHLHAQQLEGLLSARRAEHSEQRGEGQLVVQ